MSRSVRFEAFEFDPESGELWKSGHLVALPPQPATVLSLLVERAQRHLRRPSRERDRAQPQPEAEEPAG